MNYLSLDPIAAAVLGILVGVLCTSCLVFPRVGKAIGKTLAIGLMALGTGLSLWGLLGLVGPAEFEPLQCGPVLFSSAAQALGWGAGSLCGGITALVLASLRNSR